MYKPFFIWASFFAFTAVMLGAMGAHALKSAISPESLASFETGVRYQFYHAIGLFIASFVIANKRQPLFLWAGWLFITGVFFFSGSIYLLACRDLLGIGHWSWLGPITPVGGLLFLAGWAAFAFGAFKK